MEDFGGDGLEGSRQVETDNEVEQGGGDQGDGNSEGDAYLNGPVDFPERDALDWVDDLEPIVSDDDIFGDATEQVRIMYSHFD